MDMLAARIGLDPLTLRKKNALKVGDRSIIGALDDAADLREMIERIEQ
jgi:CO/xanthine dehydrogenase Mo-binding subunit